MVTPNNEREGTPHHIHIKKKSKRNWLPWLLAALALLVLLFALSRCDREETSTVETAAVPAQEDGAAEIVAATPNAGEASALAGTAGLDTYLASTEPTPRTFVFERLNFDTAASDIRPADRAEVDQVAAALIRNPSARITIAGYADARGADAANMALGKARADSIRAALVDRGIDAARIETVSGGENDPVDSNATASGRFENRRTELVVTAR